MHVPTFADTTTPSANDFKLILTEMKLMREENKELMEHHSNTISGLSSKLTQSDLTIS